MDLDFIHYSLNDESIKSFVEKLRSLLIFGSNSRRYKDIFDLFYLKNLVNEESLKKIISVLIFDDDIESIAAGILEFLKELI